MEKTTDSTEQPNNDEDVQPFETNDSTACNGVANLFCKLSIFFSLTTLFFVHSAHTDMELIKEEDHEEEQIKNEEEQPLETNDCTTPNG